MPGAITSGGDVHFLTLVAAVLGGAALAVMRLLARSLVCLSSAARGAAGFGAAGLHKQGTI